MNNLNIRPVELKDLEALSEIYCKVYEAFNVGERWDQASAYKLLRHWFERQPDLCFLAELDGKIVGAFVAAIKPWWDGNRLVDGEIFVDSDYQKRGVGTELSKKMYRSAIEKYNAKCFDTYTFSGSEHPLSWYKKQGFIENNDWTNISGNLKEILKNLEKNDK